MPMIDPRYRLLYVGLFAAFAVFGTSMTIIGAALPKILASFGWSYLVAGTVLAANAIAYFSFTYIGGHVIKLWGAKRTITVGLAITATALLFFAARPDPWLNILLAFCIGVGQGFVEITVNWSTLRLDQAKSGRPMNLMHGAFALGAIAGPLALGLLLAGGYDWIAIYRILAGIFGLLAVLLLIPAMPGTEEPAPQEASTPAARLSSHPAYWLSFLALFLYVGVELGVSNWIAEYFVSVLSYPAEKSAFLVSLFWIGLLAGRFGVPILYRGRESTRLFVWLSALATLSIGGLSLLGSVPVSGVSLVLVPQIGLGLVFLAGLGSSIFYPAIITLLGNTFPQSQSQVIGFAATGGGIGAFFFPFLMSALAQGWGLRAGFATYALFGLAMTAAALGLVLASQRRPKG